MMNQPLRPLGQSELAPYASNGNGFSRLEDARAVAKARPGQEVIVQEGHNFVLHAVADQAQLSQLSAFNSQQIVLEFVGADHQILNLDNPEGIRGVGQKLSLADLKNHASGDNAFGRFTHAESVAKKLSYPTAIVHRHGHYELFRLTDDSAKRLLAGQNDLLDGKVTAVVRSSQTLYNWGAERKTAQAHPGVVYSSAGKLMLDDKPFTIRGMNVYDLVEVGQRSPAELKKTLQLLADTGVNSVRLLALSKHQPEDLKRVLDTAREMKLDMKFIPVLGNHWSHVEAKHSAYNKDESWYRQDFEHHYWPHAKATVEAVIDYPEILMWELMNEPEAQPETLRQFADDVSTRMRDVYTQREAQTGQPVPHHLIGLGTRSVGRYGEEVTGMEGHEYKDLYGLPNLDVATTHDYTSDTLEGSIADEMRYARDLNKPFFLGEIGVKVRGGGTESKPELFVSDRLKSSLGLSPTDPAVNRQAAIQRLKEKIQASQQAGSAGAMLWGPQPNGYAVDGDGYGFTYQQQDAAFQELLGLFQSF
ncbi:MAG: cellulase family glycosylhydrolase [Candidatus Sericytochromatia bacterium]|nr:cellulase family glycosylhydrolase [Candidatus Sericytochromatia bacterium]